jgi:hypothetical protein
MCSIDRTVRDAEPILRKVEHVVPEPRFQVALHLRQVEIRTATASDQLVRIVEKVQPEIEESASHWLIINVDMLLDKVPAARSHRQGGGCVIQAILTPLRADEGDRPANGITQVELPLNDVFPGWGVGILKIRHKDLCARVERIDHHTPISRTGNLNPPIGKVSGNGSHPPIAAANVNRLRQEIGQCAGFDVRPSLITCSQQRAPAMLELTRQ